MARGHRVAWPLLAIWEGFGLRETQLSVLNETMRTVRSQIARVCRQKKSIADTTAVGLPLVMQQRRLMSEAMHSILGLARFVVATALVLHCPCWTVVEMPAEQAAEEPKQDESTKKSKMKRNIGPLESL